MLTTKLFLLLVFSCCFIKGVSQTIPTSSKSKKTTVGYYLSHTPWTIQLGGNVVDDDGKRFKDLFNVSKSHLKFLSSSQGTKRAGNAKLINSKSGGDISNSFSP